MDTAYSQQSTSEQAYVKKYSCSSSDTNDSLEKAVLYVKIHL